MSLIAFRLLNHLALPLLTVAMETCWLYPWAMLLGIWIKPTAYEPLLSAFSIFMLLIVANQATYLTFSREWPLERTRWMLIGAGVVTVLLALRIDHFREWPLTDPSWFTAMASAFLNAAIQPTLPIFATALGFYLWWRGIMQGRDQGGYDRIEGAFRFGIIALLVFLFMSATKGSEGLAPLEPLVGPYVIGFFLLGLTCLSLARLETIRERSRARNDDSLPLNRHWFAVVTSMVAVLILFALVVGQIFSFDLAAAVLNPILAVINAILIAIVYVLALPLIWSMEFFASVFASLMRRERPPMEAQQQQMSIFEELQIEQATSGFPPELVLIAKWVGIAFIALVGLFFLLRAISRWYEWENADEVAEERDSVWEEWSLKAIILAWLRSLLRRFARGRTETVALEDISLIPTSAEPPSVTTIRQIYRQLLRLGASLGSPRARDATPYEHLIRLRTHMRPEADLTAITEAYVRTRYSSAAAENEEIGEVQHSWERVRTAASAQPSGDSDNR